MLVSESVYQRGCLYFGLFYDCVGISLFFSLCEYEHLKYVGYINEKGSVFVCLDILRFCIVVCYGGLRIQEMR